MGQESNPLGVVVYWLIVALAALSIAAFVLIASPRVIHTQEDPLLAVNDRPLLTAEQQAEARETGRTAFVRDGELVVLETVPQEYLVSN